MSDYTQESFWPQLKQLAVNIDGLDYYQILNLNQGAGPTEIRGSYYNLARALHPDKFFHIADRDLKDAVHKIYKRVTESYTILKDESKRQRYLRDITGPDRMKKLRFTEESDAETKQEQKLASKIAKTPRGEQLYNAAMIDAQAGRYDQAFRNIQSATLFEPANADLKRLMAEYDAKRKGSV
jgi:DnaJ-class molecular chaperone